MRIHRLILILLLFLLIISTGETATLKEIIDISLDRAFTLKAADYELEMSEQNYKLARSSRYPSLSLSAVSFYNSEVATIDVPIPPTGMSIETGSNDNYQFDFKLSVPLYTGGKISNQVGISEEHLTASRYNLDARKMQLAYNVRLAYFSYLSAQKLLESIMTSKSRVGLVVEDVGNLYANGMADSIDILETNLALFNIKEQIIKSESILEQTSIVLRNYLGWGNEKSLNIKTDNLPSNFRQLNADEIINRAELDVYKHNIKALNKLKSLKSADYFPNISAYVGYSYGMPNKQMVDPEWNDNYMAGIGLDWRFNFGGAVKYSTGSARAQMVSAEMAMQGLTESLELQKNIALNQIDEAIANIKVAEQKLNIARSKYELAKEKQASGVLSLYRLLEIEKELTSAEEIYQLAVINYYLAQTEYYYAIGSNKIFGGIENE